MGMSDCYGDAAERSDTENVATIHRAKERGVNGRPEYVRSTCEASLKRLKTDYIDLYYQHRIRANDIRRECRHLVDK